jgi:hypothetical protein
MNHKTSVLSRDSLAIAAPLECSLWPDKGPQPSFFSSVLTTPACPTIVDCFGRLKDALPGEALFYGARRVENLLRYTEHLSFAGSGGWFLNANATIVPVTDSRRPGSDGAMSTWKLSRAALTNSVLRQIAAIRRVGRPAGLDLLQPVLHVAAINIRKSTTNVVSTAEIRVYVVGSSSISSKIVTISDTLQTYGVTFTPAIPKRITNLEWSSGLLTITSPAHGLSNGMTVRLSGSLPSTFDAEAAITLINADSFRVSLASNPGAATSFGWVQPAYFFGIAPDNFSATGLGDIEVEYPYVSEIEGYSQGHVCEYVPRNRIPADKYWYGAGVDGVRYYDSASGWKLNSDLGSISGARGPRLSTLRGIALYAQTQSLIPRKFSEYLSGWDKSDTSVSAIDYADYSPLGSQEASRIVEGTASGQQYVQLPAGFLTGSNTGSGVLSTITAYLATPDATAGREWSCISFVDRAGTTQTAYANLITGQVGNFSSGVRNVHMEPLAVIGGLKFWRIHIEINNGTGSSAPILRIGLAEANNNNSYTGSGTRYIICWGVAYCGGTLSRPTAAPYGRAHHESNPTLAGAALQFDTRGVLGTGRIVAHDICTPYYRARQTDKFEYSATLYFRVDAPQFISSATPSSPAPAPMDRFGIVIRPNPSPSSVTHQKWAIDHYNGDPNPFYMFVENGYYKIGDIVIPTDTLPNNDNARPMFTVISVTGQAGAEPVWPVVTVPPSATVTSGGVTFRCIHDNGINGRWEPYNGAAIMPPDDFMAEIRNAFFISSDDYGAAINGIVAVKQTEPQPVNPIYKYDMRYPIRSLHVGQLGSPWGYDPSTLTPYVGADAAALMPRLTSFHRNILVWNTECGPTDIEQLTK